MKRILFPLLALAALAQSASAQPYSPISLAIGPTNSGTDNTPYVLWEDVANNTVELASYYTDNQSGNGFGLQYGGMPESYPVGWSPSGVAVLGDYSYMIYSVPGPYIGWLYNPYGGTATKQFSVWEMVLSENQWYLYSHWAAPCQVQGGNMSTFGFTADSFGNLYFGTWIGSTYGMPPGTTQVEAWNFAGGAEGYNSIPSSYSVPLGLGIGPSGPIQVLTSNSNTGATQVLEPSGSGWYDWMTEQAISGWSPVGVSGTPNGHIQVLWESYNSSTGAFTVSLWDTYNSNGNGSVGLNYWNWTLPVGQYPYELATCDVTNNGAVGDGQVYMLTSNGQTSGMLYRLNMKTGGIYWRGITP